MKVLLSWLKEFVVELDDDVDAIGDRLSALGLAVESRQTLGAGIEPLVVAKVLDLRPHPDADRIQLVDVDAGDGNALQVCCGAFNMSIGDLIPFAPIGAVMPNGMEIARREMRGETSNGMCCSASEIGLGDDDDGIMLLTEMLDGDSVGMPLGEALGVRPDTLWDLEVNANRPDAMSVAGVARDLAGSMGLKFAYPDYTYEVRGDGVVGDVASVEIIDTELCGRFAARVLTDVKVGSSPAWMQRRLSALGMRPINRIVDISNYVMLELGQPNHTYDLELLHEGALRVRRATDGESIVTLDDVGRTLAASDGVIANGDDEAIGIAGVMGGQSTEISDSTSSVLVEMAWWDPPSISRSIKRLNLPSEASTRFRRGADWGKNIERALDRFCQLVSEDGGATVVAGTIDEHGVVPDRSPVQVRTTKVNAVLGTDLSAEDMGGLLESIGFTSTPRDEGLDVALPTWRWDCSNETDIIEEIGRLHGFENIARTVPRGIEPGRLSEVQQARRRVRDVLAGLGCDETQPLPFLAPGDLSAAGLGEEGIALSNPLVADESILRTSLLPGQLKAIAYNESHRNGAVRLFEIGHVYLPSPAGQLLPDEREFLAVALSESHAADAVSVLLVLAEGLALPNLEVVNGAVSGLHPTRSGEVRVAGAVRGEVGQVDPLVAEAFGVASDVAWLQLDLGAVLDGPHGNRKYTPVSKFPSSDVDLAFDVDDSVPAARVGAALRSAGKPLLVSSVLFDVFRGDGVSDGHRGLTYRLRFQSREATLTDEEVGAARQACIDKAEAIDGVRLRS